MRPQFPQAHVRRRGSRTRGYTLVEVMSALAILAIGATGVIALQKTALVGNAAARNLVTANAIATTWIERLRADAAQWNTTSATGTVDEDTTWLKQVKTNAGKWIVPDTVAGRGSARADVFGADLYADAPADQQAFCTQMRLTQLYPTFIRAEIRVFWSRATGPVSCADVGDTDAPDSSTYGFVFTTGGIFMNTSRAP